MKYSQTPTMHNDHHTRILTESLGRQFKRPQSPRRQCKTLSPLKQAEEQYSRMKKKSLVLHVSSPKQQGLICMTIKEMDELCMNTKRYSKYDNFNKYYLNNRYFDQVFSSMNQKKLQVYDTLIRPKRMMIYD